MEESHDLRPTNTLLCDFEYDSTSSTVEAKSVLWIGMRSERPL